MTNRDMLRAVSPLDGRYARYTEPLVPYTSEAGLMRERVRVEVEYLITLAELRATPLSIAQDSRAMLRTLYESFDTEDAAIIKRYETDGYAGRSATNHDVKAIEYFVRDAMTDGLEADRPWVHFGLTSEDVNNLAQRLLVKPAVDDVLVPAIRAVRDELSQIARVNRDLPMLSHTHGQPATPTTFGKEMAVYAARLGNVVGEVERAAADLSGKLAGASGALAAHHAAYPDVDWQTFSRSFVTSLGLEHTSLATQVNPCDDLAHLFRALQGVNNVLLDLNRDVWSYISMGYLGQETEAGETGSSTMPHKVNPIDFENSEGNCSKANADLEFLADYITSSRLQRDLSDSTVKRNIGGALAYCLISYEKTLAGLGKVVPRPSVMAEDLAANPEVIGEAVQTILRREGHADAYERVKALSRGQRLSLEAFQALFDELEVSDATREELHTLTPADYTGLASALVEDL
jgi:adenylosuccinate lyase